MFFCYFFIILFYDIFCYFIFLNINFILYIYINITLKNKIVKLQSLQYFIMIKFQFFVLLTFFFLSLTL